jgi:hypothetical protein
MASEAFLQKKHIENLWANTIFGWFRQRSMLFLCSFLLLIVAESRCYACGYGEPHYHGCDVALGDDV